MPVKSLNSSVHTWPDPDAVLNAVTAWAAAEAAKRAGLVRLGLFGSYARKDAGVGSDLDLVAVVETADAPFERRSLDWDLNALPVPAELLVYSEDEWQRLLSSGGRFARTLENETVWLYP